MHAEIIPQAFVNNAHITYKGSAWDDGSDRLAAQPTDKGYFFNGQTAGFQNYTTYSKGINNLFVDVFRPSPYLTADDFTFKVGTTDDTSTWTDAPTPTMTVYPPVFDGGVSPISFDWPDGAITNTWLQVKVIASPLNAFANDVTLYFGNVVGDTGNSSSNTIVNLIDVGLTRQNQQPVQVPIDYDFDFNRDKRVNLIDVAIARFNQSGLFALPLITPFESSSVSSKASSAADTTNNVVSLPRSFSFDANVLANAKIDEKFCLRSKVDSHGTTELGMNSATPAIQTALLPDWFERDEQPQQKRDSQFQPADVDELMRSVFSAN